MPPPNSKSSTQLSGQSDPESGAESKPGRGSKPSKDSPQDANNVHFEPFHKRVYDMSYACLLIPRHPEHLLTGKIAEFVEKTMKSTCGTFGWTLGFVQVRPEYLQWVISATFGTPPSKCIHTIREQTSKGLLDKFKEFRDGAQYADFWAPGYLVLVGEKPHPQSIIEEFIKLTRQQQKLSRQDP